MRSLLIPAFMLTLITGVALAGPPTFPGNGDVNNDGARDLSDAISLLAHLFQGGPGPEACPDTPTPTTPTVILPATNQLVCYDTTFLEDFPPELLPAPDCDVFNCADAPPYPHCWTTEYPDGVDPRYCHQDFVTLISDPDEMIAPDGTVEADCLTAPSPGQDGQLQNGISNTDRFVDNTDGTVTDTATGLMWTQDTVDANGIDGVTTDDNINWCAALAACEDLDFAGHTDWRLPNIRELESIVDYGRVPTIDPVFDLTGGPLYWSSTSYDEAGVSDSAVIGSMDLARSVFFDDGENPNLEETAGSWESCRKSDDNCICRSSGPHPCIDADDLNKVYARAVRTVPLSGGAGGSGRGQGAATLGNGDVNGDDTIDLSDAIYLLAFLFQGGPEPEACPGSGSGGGLDVDNIGRLTSTLTTSFLHIDCFEEGLPDDWSKEDCAVVTCPGQDGFYEAEGSHSCQGKDRFIDNGDSTATDNCTGLMWHKGRSWPTPELGGRLDWAQAIAWVETIVYIVDEEPFPPRREFKTEAQAILDGDENNIKYDDWRMPNIRELETIRDYNRVGQYLGGPLQARRAAYWSSTTVPSKPSHAFGFLTHARITIQKNNPLYHVRPVRTATTP
jgi:hypothetical protein